MADSKTPSLDRLAARLFNSYCNPPHWLESTNERSLNLERLLDSRLKTGFDPSIYEKELRWCQVWRWGETEMIATIIDQVANEMTHIDWVKLIRIEMRRRLREKVEARQVPARVA